MSSDGHFRRGSPDTTFPGSLRLQSAVEPSAAMVPCRIFHAGAAAEPTGSVQGRIGKPQSLASPKAWVEKRWPVRALGIRAARTCDGNPRFPTVPLRPVRSGTVCSSPTNHGQRRRRHFGSTRPQRQRVLADPIIVGRTVAKDVEIEMIGMIWPTGPIWSSTIRRPRAASFAWTIPPGTRLMPDRNAPPIGKEDQELDRDALAVWVDLRSWNPVDVAAIVTWAVSARDRRFRHGLAERTTRSRRNPAKTRAKDSGNGWAGRWSSLRLGGRST